MTSWVNAAQLKSAQGLKGRLLVQGTRGLPFLLHEGLEVSFVPPTLDGPRRAVVEFVQHSSDDEYVVGFKAVSDKSTADDLAGSFCLVRRTDVEDLMEDDPYDDDIIGYEVVDASAGLLGELTDILDMPMQQILQITGDSEILIPAVAEFVVDIDDDSKRIFVDVPESLLNMNR